MDTSSPDAKDHSHPNKKSSIGTNFIFTHAGRTIDREATPDEAGIEHNDVIMAVELMDLTQADAVRPLYSCYLI